MTSSDPIMLAGTTTSAVACEAKISCAIDASTSCVAAACNAAAAATPLAPAYSEFAVFCVFIAVVANQEGLSAVRSLLSVSRHGSVHNLYLVPFWWFTRSIHT